MLSLIRAFVDIALHRRGPEDLPPSQFLLVLVLVAYLFVASVGLSLAPPLERTVLLLAFDTLLYAAFVFGVLKAFKHEKRFVQTATALLGTDTLLNSVSLPLLLWTRALESANANATIPNVLFLVLFIWSVDVSGHVVSRAIGRAYVVGVSIMIGYVLLSISVRASLFPANPN